MPRFGNLKASSLSYRDIERLHHELSRSTPFQANRVVALLSRLYSLAVKWRISTENPARGIQRNPETPRERYLSQAELARLLAALDRHSDQTIANAIRLLVFTGARKTEVLGATWEQFDLDTGIWTKPAATVKQARLHRVAISSAAINVLRELRQQAHTNFLFPGGPNQPIQDIKKSWHRIRADAGLGNLRLHDLRHTFASHLVSSGRSLSQIGALLGHTQQQTTMRYAHLFDEAMREATESFADLVLRPQRQD